MDGAEGFGYECLLVHHTARTPSDDGVLLCNMNGEWRK